MITKWSLSLDSSSECDSIDNGDDCPNDCGDDFASDCGDDWYNDCSKDGLLKEKGKKD